MKMMKKSYLKKFYGFSFSKNEMSLVKGGSFFYGWYLHYTEANDIKPNPTILQHAIGLDRLASKYGMEVAMMEGGEFFIDKYGY